MKESEEDKKQEQTGESEESEERIPEQTPAAEIATNLILIDRGVSTLEPRFTHRVLRPLTSLRKKLNVKVLTDAIELAYPAGTFTGVSLM
jgi:26S proteasome regulatory subunit N3